jgi:hypothetical protein
VIRIRRHVLHVPGYDPVPARDHFRRFKRQLEIFQQTWRVQSTISEFDGSGAFPRWRVNTKGAEWETDTEVEFLAWDDIVAAESRKTNLTRIPRALAAYSNLLLTGTLIRYARANTRYFLFAIVPLLELILLAAIACIAGYAVVTYFRTPDPLGYALMLLLALGFMELLMRWPGAYLRLPQALDDWIASVDYIYGRHGALEKKSADFAHRISGVLRDNHADEIIIVGHSLGATFAVDAVARALSGNGFEPSHSRICIATLGATIPKCVLHPAATELRAKVQNVVESDAVDWVEYQARADAISFYRFDPAARRRIEKTFQTTGKPLIRIVQLNDMLKPETFRRFRLRIMRLHYQFVSANDRPASYDYFMMLCGPLLFKTWTRSKLGFLDFPGFKTVSAARDH